MKLQTPVKPMDAAPAPAPKKRKKKPLIIGAAVVVVVALALALLRPGGRGTAFLDLADTTLLTYTDLEKTIAGTGIVESRQHSPVYSSLSYRVETIHAELGDWVDAGQLLAELDGQSIRDQITSLEITMNNVSTNSSQQLQVARENYENYKYGLENGLNTALLSAEKQVSGAKDALDKAQLALERYQQGLDKEQNTTIIGAEIALRNAKNALDTAQRALDDLQEAVEDAEDQLDEVDEDWSDAFDSLGSLESSLRKSNNSLQQLKTQLEASLAKDGQRARLQSEIDTLEADIADSASSADLAALQQLLAEKAQALAALGESETASLRQHISRAETGISSLELSITQVQSQIAALEASYIQAEAVLENAEDQLDNAQRNLDNAQANYDAQLASYQASLTGVDQALADYRTNVTTAQKNYQDALTSLEATKKSTQEQLQTYYNALVTAQNNTNTAANEESLRQLRESLEKTKITAPCAGTVTAIYAEVGAAGAGLLFVIEDTERLMVNTTIKGYDVGKLQTGVKVSIQSEATGDARFEGVLSMVAPTANKGPQGTTVTGGDAIFAAEVDILSTGTGLRIGMEADLDYILESQAHVLAVPYDAVYKNDKGQTCVLVAEPQGSDSYLLRELPVVTGMDDDLDIAVSGDGVTEGLRIVSDPGEYLEQLGKTLKVGKRNALVGPMGMMG